MSRATHYVAARRLCLIAALFGVGPVEAGVVYEVGPGRAHETPLTVPWAELGPGDEVRIHARPEPYRAKWVIGRSGTANAPIVVRGVPSAEGVLPVIDGRDEQTANGLDYWGGHRSVLKIGGSNVPPDSVPRHIVIEGLHLRGAAPPHRFADCDGTIRGYSKHAAPLWIEKGEGITVRGCVLSEGGNGLMISSSDALPSRDIRVEQCHIHSNGNEGSVTEHNVYTAALGLVFEGNRLGPLRPGARGNNLKDRSAGLEVRYNWFEGGNRQLDLVQAEDSVAIRSDPSYRVTRVYGNVFIEPAGDGNRQIVQYGGDNPAVLDQYRGGVLQFFHNTVVSYRTDWTALFRLTTNGETCEVRNNILYAVAAPGLFRLAEGSGRLVFGRNLIRPGWRNTTPSGHSGRIEGLDALVVSDVPPFGGPGGPFVPGPGSPAVDAGERLSSAMPPVEREYETHLRTRKRPVSGAPDLGAYECVPARLAGE